MLNIKNVLKEFATYVAFSLCFTAIFVLLFFFFFYKKVEYYSSLINTFAVANRDTTKTEISYNTKSKRLISYPDYGEKYAELSLDSLGITMPVFFGDTLKILRKGVGHYAGSYFPGEEGTIILAAHYNDTYFGNLYKLKLNDHITIKTGYGTFIYEVDEFKVILETEKEAFPIQKEKEILIMYTCYPRNTIGRKFQRYLVFAHKVEDSNV